METLNQAKVLTSTHMDDRPAKRNATYADLESVPENKVAELIDGNLYIHPRPRSTHARAINRLSRELGPADDDTSKRGWIILSEVAVWLNKKHTTLLVPDLCGWRRDRMPTLLDVQTFDQVPDWICEGLSPSTARHDKGRKLTVYAKNKVPHLWYVDPKLKTLEILRFDRDAYRLVRVAGGDERGVFEPFSHVIDLSRLWAR